MQVERAAHDETAEKMVQLQQRLEVTLQELANLERFTKKQQQTASAPPNVEQLLKEESYLKARLLYVQQVRAASQASGWRSLHPSRTCSYRYGFPRGAWCTFDRSLRMCVGRNGPTSPPWGRQKPKTMQSWASDASANSNLPHVRRGARSDGSVFRPPSGPSRIGALAPQLPPRLSP